VPAIFGCFAGLGWHADNNGAVRFPVDAGAGTTTPWFARSVRRSPFCCPSASTS